jgi:hypothetical protein
MFITKSRTALITLVASASFAIAGIAPAVSQAQWHTICSGGACITHANYQLAGQHACGPADVEGTNPKGGLDGATQPAAGEASDAQAVQAQLNAFEGVCAN